MSHSPWDYIAKLVCIGDSGTGKSSLTIRLCEGRFSPTHDVTIGVEFGSRIVPVGPPASLSLSINDPSKPPISSEPASANGSPPPTSNGTSPPSKPKPRAKSPAKSDDPPRQKKMKLSLWDTAGQETYKSVTRSYFRGASGALLVYDVTRRETFDAVTSWLHDLRQIAEEGIIVVLVGNKVDLAGSESMVERVGDRPDPRPETDGAGQGDEQKGLKKDEHNLRKVPRTEAREWCARNHVPYFIETSAKSGEGVERAFLEVAERIYQNIEAGKYDLNDRRSGVKGPGAGGGGAGTAKGGQGGGTVKLGMGMNDVAKGVSNGCC